MHESSLFSTSSLTLVISCLLDNSHSDWCEVKFHCGFILFYTFIYLFLAALGLRCCVWAFSSRGEQGLLFVAVHGLLIVVTSLVVEHRLWVHGLQ